MYIGKSLVYDNPLNQLPTFLGWNSNIIIKPADNGGKIVLLDKTSYLQEAYRQLNNSNNHTLVHHDPISDLALETSSFISFLYNRQIY